MSLLGAFQASPLGGHTGSKMSRRGTFGLPLYVAGATSLTRYNSMGVIQWRRDLPADASKVLIVDEADNAYLTCNTTEDPVISYDVTGELRWRLSTKVVNTSGGNQSLALLGNRLWIGMPSFRTADDPDEEDGGGLGAYRLTAAEYTTSGSFVKLWGIPLSEYPGYNGGYGLLLASNDPDLIYFTFGISLLALTRDHQIAWRYDLPSGQAPRRMDFDTHEESVVILSQSSSDARDWTLWKIHTGSLEWSASLPIANSTPETTEMIINNKGEILIGMQFTGAGSINQHPYTVYKFSRDGTVRTDLIHRNELIFVDHIAAAQDGRFAVLGQRQNRPPSARLYGVTGDAIWSSTTPLVNGNRHGRLIAIGPKVQQLPPDDDEEE